MRHNKEPAQRRQCSPYSTAGAAVEKEYENKFTDGPHSRGVAVDGFVVQRGASYLTKPNNGAGGRLSPKWMADSFEDIRRPAGGR